MHAYSICYLMCGSWIVCTFTCLQKYTGSLGLGLFQFTFVWKPSAWQDVMFSHKNTHFSDNIPLPMPTANNCTPLNVSTVTCWVGDMRVCVCVCTCKRLCMNLKSAYAYARIALWRKSYWLFSVGRSPCLLTVKDGRSGTDDAGEKTWRQREKYLRPEKEKQKRWTAGECIYVLQPNQWLHSCVEAQ